MHKKIGRLGRQPACPKLFFERFHRLDHLRIALPQQAFALLHIAGQPSEGLRPVVGDVQIAQTHGRLEIDQRENMLRSQLRRIGIPHEKRIDRRRIIAHESHEIEDARVVFRSLDAHVMQRRRIAEVVFRGISIGVEHVPRRIDRLRLLGTPGEKIVEVRVDAQQQVVARLGDHVQQHLLALGQIVAVGHRNLEPQIGIAEMVEDAAPESYVLISLDEDPHQPLRRIGRQRLRKRLVRSRTCDECFFAQFVHNQPHALRYRRYPLVGPCFYFTRPSFP